MPELQRGAKAGTGAISRRSARRTDETAGPAARAQLLEGTEQPSAQRVLRQFRVVFNAVKTHFQQLERKVGVSGAEVWALHVIRQHPGIGIGALAQMLNVRQPTASILVKSLVHQELIITDRAESDRRAVVLRIEPKGRALLRRVPGPYEGVLPDALKDLDAETLFALENALGKLIAKLGAGDRAGAIPLSHL